MELFSHAIEEFDENITRICSTMKSAVEMAESGMNDDSTAQAAKILYELIAEVEDVTNPLDDVGSSISKAAKVLHKIEDITFRR